MLYFGDAQLVQKHLHEDLNKIIKNVKIREQQHLQLLQYNKSIATKKRSIQTTIFINDQITTHNKFYTRILQQHEQLLKDQEEILEKYSEASVRFQSVMKLMARVVTRIVETNMVFVEKIKLYDDGFVEMFAKMKNVLMKLINNKDLIDLGLGTKTIIEYSKVKATQQIQKLKQLIKTLQDGEIQKVPFIYKGIKPPQPPKPQPAKLQTPKQQKPIQKKSSPPKKQQKHEIVSKMKNQIKTQQNLKKQKKTFATKLVSMYSTMDLSKKDFMQDIVTSNVKQFDRIYGEILLRNKFNQEQILQFQAKKEEFNEKVKTFKERMIEESNKIQQVLMIKKPVKIQKRADTQSQSTTKIQPTVEQDQDKNPQFDESPTREFKRAFILRQKQASPRFHKQTDFTQMRVTQQGFNHIKFDSSNQQIFLRSNRNRLPQIQQQNSYNSTCKQSQSIDQQRYHLSKSKEDNKAPQNRKNFLMKNIELGVQNVIKQNQQKNQSQNKCIADKLKQLQPTITTTNNINLMEFTFYGSKRKSFVLGESKNTFVF